VRVEGINRICVVGAGTMGSQIALCGALAGYTVVCSDIDHAALERARRFTDTYLSGRVARGKLDDAAAQVARDNLSFTTDLAEAAAGADLAIEAAPEVLELKRTLFRRLDRICPAHALLVTNSSFIVSSKLAEVTRRPEKVANMHFFVPPLAMSPVEVVQGPHTAAQTAATIAAVCTSMGKTPIMLRKEIHGFLVNRILSVIQREAQFLHDTGVASFEDIDTAVREGLGHKVGPFYQMDLIGLDLVYAIGREHFRESGDPSQRPSPAVVERVARNELGRKTGKGFYDYEGMLKERGF